MSYVIFINKLMQHTVSFWDFRISRRACTQWDRCDCHQAFAVYVTVIECIQYALCYIFRKNNTLCTHMTDFSNTICVTALWIDRGGCLRFGEVIAVACQAVRTTGWLFNAQQR